jgi:signal transduction histidine kinase
VAYRIYDVFDGFRSGFALFNAATRTNDGRLWFANDNVAQVIDPHGPRANKYVPPVHIESLIADHKEIALTGKVELPPLTQSLEIRYTGLSMAVPQKVLFKYRLEGHDSNWEEAGTRRQAFYNDLPPGKYEFRVIACNNDGLWNEAGETLAFSVQPAWYQTVWFRVLCGLAILVVVTLLYQLRVRQIAQYLNARLEERLAERTRIARELHDTLLQSVQALILNVDAATRQVSRKVPENMQAREALEKALARADNVMSEGRSRVLNLRTAIDSTDDLPQAFANVCKDLASDNGVPCTMTVEGEPRALDPKVQDELFWIGREALQNASNHASAKAIEVQCIFASDTLRIRIRDDGVGFDLNDSSVATRPGHWGLKGMNERATSIGAKVEIWSRSGAGTEIEVSIPAKLAYLKRSQSWFSWPLRRASWEN